MYVDVKNENYGYSVGTYGKYAAFGNPRLIRWNSLTSSLIQTGSIDVFRYDGNTDTHIFIDTLKRPVEDDEAILIAKETAFALEDDLQTEDFGLDWINKSKNIRVDYLNYFTQRETDYGQSLDWYDRKLATGCTYFWDRFEFSSSVFDFTSSCVDIWDYSYSERNQYLYNTLPKVVGYGYTGSFASISFGITSSVNLNNIDLSNHRLYFEQILVPPGYDELLVFVSSSFQSGSSLVSKISVSPDGEYATYAFTASLTSSIHSITYKGNITNEIRHFHLSPPDGISTGSFGTCVSLNRNWLAVGHPLVSGSKGAVYIYQNKCTGSFLSWSLYQTLFPDSLIENQKFGWDLALDKNINACSDRLIVGCGAADNNTVYLFELSGSHWYESYQFHQITSSLGPLTFDAKSYPILLSSSYKTSSFGHAVGIFGDTVVIGAPYERVILEYTGSQAFEQGTAYIFERCSNVECPTTQSDYRLMKKVYGDQYTLKNNRLGYSVCVFGENMVIGIPKRSVSGVSSCYVRSSIPQQLYCEYDLENDVHGQWMFLSKNVSGSWEINKVYQKKKRFLSPHRSYGKDVCISTDSIVVGAPIIFNDLNRKLDLVYTESLGIKLDDIMGKGYIYNLWNYKPEFYVGNVFYRNGTLIVNTSGSAFEGLYFNPTSPYTYEYNLSYNSQHLITEKQIVCTVEPGEFNVSTNPTAIILPSSSFDLNKNGKFDFQDVDVLLRYMQYKNSTSLGQYSFDWSSSILKSEDEISFYNYNSNLWNGTEFLFSRSLKQFESTEFEIDDIIDFNEDNKIDINDMNILWKYFSNRLTEKNYLTYINSNCKRQHLNEAIIYIDSISKRTSLPQIAPEFFNYDAKVMANPTGSFLAPMVTTIGLYDGLDLVAVAKLGAPIKLPKSLPINFIVKMDF